MGRRSIVCRRICCLAESQSATIGDMKPKTLAETNPHLRDAAKATRQQIRSVASSTAIETGQPVRDIEARIRHLRSLPSRVTLA